MAATTIVFGALMILLGVVGYFATGRQSLTAMIPAIPGALFVLLGALAFNPSLRKHVMHAAAALSLVGMLGMIPGLIKLVKWMGGTEPARPAAVVSQSILAGLLLVFLVLCVRSFVNARRAREAAPGFEVAPPTAGQ